ncbi:hypothetical protein ACLJYM_27285 [Rhizobium giardinii]|uniref:hypothetical protein n=1 Tax=Rhizobium giardinii TaxID=56731 RepID=UPI000DD7B786
MDRFKRAFAVGHLSGHRGNRGVSNLFDRWVLPGEDAGAYGLRLAVRNGYLNFYVKGQSVGEMRLVGGSPSLRLHFKYKSSIQNGSSQIGAGGQSYNIVDASELAMAGPDLIDNWIRTAETYAGDEKRFVDDLVAVTAGAIDLEMGLPADQDAVGEDRTAPRMDMVVAQGSEVAFWEAKCAVNSELRARASYKERPESHYCEGPRVIWQLRRYQRWMSRPLRISQVRNAYVEAAQLLLSLAELWGKQGPAMDAWRELAASGEKTPVFLPPGIVVGGYCPTRADGLSRVENNAYLAKIKSFGEHEARLRRHGVTVVTVTGRPNGPVLPSLGPGCISAEEREVC